jgi:hypothetical protein
MRIPFRQTKREPDVEGNPVENLDFDDPRWIIDHHRQNLIEKIYKPESSWFEVLRHLGRKRSARNTEAPRSNQNHNDQERRAPNDQRSASNHDHEQSYRINFSELQRLRLRQLQRKLVQHIVDLRYDATEPSGWADDLRQYGESNEINNH